MGKFENTPSPYWISMAKQQLPSFFVLQRSEYRFGSWKYPYGQVIPELHVYLYF